MGICLSCWHNYADLLHLDIEQCIDPELEEGYDKYYAQLEDVEDDDFFLEE